MAINPWSEDEVSRCIELFAEGLKPPEIAAAINRPTSSVTRRISDMENGKFKADLQAKIRAARKVRYAKFGNDNERQVWEPYDDDRITALFKEGLSDKMIADRLNRSYKAVQRRRSILGLVRVHHATSNMTTFADVMKFAISGRWV